MPVFKGKEIKYNPEVTDWNGVNDLYDANRMYVSYDFVKDPGTEDEKVIDSGFFTATINQLFILRDLVKSMRPDETLEEAVRWGLLSGTFGNRDRSGVRIKTYEPGTDLVITSIVFKKPAPGQPWDDEPVTEENIWRKLRMDAKAKKRAEEAAKATDTEAETKAKEDPFGAF